MSSEASSTALPRENVFGHTAKVRFFLEHIQRERRRLRRGLRILDLGCGNGWAVTRFLGANSDQVLGIDFHEPSMRYATQHFGTDFRRFDCRDIETISRDEELWDVIVLADVLEHLDDPGRILELCATLLRDGGVLLVALPNGLGPFEIESAISRVPMVGSTLMRLVDLFVATLNKYVFRGAWTRAANAMPADLPYNSASPHVQFKSIRGWRRLFARAGFAVEAKRNLSFLAGPISNYLFSASEWFCEQKVRIAAGLPAPVVSGWTFKLAK